MGLRDERFELLQNSGTASARGRSDYEPTPQTARRTVTYALPRR